MCQLIVAVRCSQVKVKCLARMELSMAQVGRLQMFHRAMIHPDSLLGAPVPCLTAWHSTARFWLHEDAWLGPFVESSQSGCHFTVSRWSRQRQ